MTIRSTLKEVLEATLPQPAMLEVRKFYYLRKIRDVRVESEPDLAIAVRLLTREETAVDIGANYGLYTRFFAEAVGRQGYVFAIEPIPSTFAVLKSNVKGFGLSQVTVINQAVSDAPGQVTMTVPVHGGGQDFYLAHIVNGAESRRADHSFTVNASPIDALVPSALKVSVMKVDVEGHELPCMNGALRILKKDSPALLIEVSGTPDKPGAASGLFALLEGLGYKPYFSQGLAIRPYAPGSESVNYFFLKDAHLARLKSNGVQVNG